MKRIIVIIAKVLGGIVLTVLTIAVIAVFLLNSESFQKKVLQHATVDFSEKLQTRVQIDHLRIDVFGGDVELYGVDIEDRQQRKMFQVDMLEVSIDLWKLLSDEVCIRKANISGLRAQLYKERDEPANYQFVIDAFKKDSTAVDRDKVSKQTTDSIQPKKMTLNLRKASLTDVDITYNDSHVTLKEAIFKYSLLNNKSGKIKGLASQWVSHTKKGDVDNDVSLDNIEIAFENDLPVLTVNNLRYLTDNHQPRKNTGKPKRGFFDAGHFDITANLKLALTKKAADTIIAEVREGTVKDEKTGFDVRSLKLNAAIVKGVVHVSDLALRQINTEVKVDTAMLVLPSKKKDIPLSFSTGTISGRAILKDISRPFSQALKNFTIPVDFRTTMSGDDQSLHFRNVSVTTPDKLLSIKAIGDISHLKEKEQLAVEFRVSQMRTTSKKAIDIINQFAVKKLMMEQLKALGSIGFVGHFGVYYKREDFQGTLTTNAGKIDAHITLDELNKYINGNVSTKALNLGQTFAVKDLGNIACKADFKVDFSKQRTAQMRKNKNGKLPIGSARVTIDEAYYKKIRTTEIYADLMSDGAVAIGDIKKPGKFADLLCSFEYTSTTEGHHLKYNPKMKIHAFEKGGFFDQINPFKKKTETEKADSEAKKAARQAEKAARKAEKDSVKAAKKAAKAAL